MSNPIPIPIKWPGKSGQQYQFYIYPRGTKFDAVYPGIYIYTLERELNKWHPVYIGQTGDLNERQKQGYKRDQIDKAGATHIAIRVNSAGEPARLAEENDLIDLWQPECNEKGIRKGGQLPTSRQGRQGLPVIPGL